MQDRDKQINVNDPDYDDPILAEIRQIRNEFSEQFNGDIGAMSRYFEEQRRLHPINGIIETVPRRVHGGPADETGSIICDEKPIEVNDPDHVDEVMEELWQIRRELWGRFDGDIDAICRYLREQERLHPERMSTCTRRRIKPRDPKANGSASEPDAA
jgi:hypothetical protein